MSSKLGLLYDFYESVNTIYFELIQLSPNVYDCSSTYYSHPVKQIKML